MVRVSKIGQGKENAMPPRIPAICLNRPYYIEFKKKKGELKMTINPSAQNIHGTQKNAFTETTSQHEHSRSERQKPKPSFWSRFKGFVRKAMTVVLEVAPIVVSFINALAAYRRSQNTRYANCGESY
jgi:hypothetical protein